MSTEDQKALADVQEAERLVASVPLLPELDSVNVELYTDHTGEPSLQLTFHIRPGVDADKAFIKRFIDFAAVIQTKILHSEIGRFPYTRLLEAA